MPELFLVPQQPETLSDAAAREQALDTTQSWIVEAPAGSGKTGLILQRFLKLLATVDDPAQVLAITFTRKATAELHDRVLTQLRNAAAGTPPKDDYERITRPLAEAVLARDFDLLDHPHRLNVRTIDSLAMDIAAGLPVLSGSGGAKSPDPDSEPLYAEAARRTLMQLGGADQQLNRALKTVLLHRDGNLANCQDLIALMLRVRDQWGEIIPVGSNLTDAVLDEDVLPKFERALDLIICRGLGALAAALPPDLLRSLARLGADIGHSTACTGAIPEEEAGHIEHWQALVDLLLTGGGTYRKKLDKGTFKVPLDPANRAELTAIIDRISHDEALCQTLAEVRELPPAHYPPEQWLVTKALFHVLNRALAELQLVFSAHGSCDFAEVALLARAALHADSALDDLRASFGMELQHLLVDEMQDTSSGQYELIQLLTQRWDGHSQTVFLVGDPKQSIYLFRQARVERFVQTMQNGRLGDLELGTLHLTANFRSQRNLVDAFNADFSQIFPLHPDPLQPELVPYRAATAVRQPSAPRGTSWHTTIQPYSTDTEATTNMRRLQRSITAREIPPILRGWLNRPLPPGRTEPWKTAILVRNRIHLAEIVPALKHARIPYRAVEIEPLGERQEILDLIALTRALLHPADRVAWLGLLRSPWCGLGLRDLHLLAGQDDPAFNEKTIFELIGDRGDLLSDDGVARLQAFWPVISAALAERGRQPLAQWVHQTWLAFRTNFYAAEEILSNVERYFRLLDELEDPGGGLSLPRLEQRLTRLYATATVQPGAVELMTIHGSKGLEWDFVLVPGLERLGMNTQGSLLDWTETDPADLESGDDIAPGIVAPIRSKGVLNAKLNDWIKSLDKARTAAEVKRLYYVACTRAREELHLFAAIELNKANQLKPKSGSLLAAAWPAAQQHFAALQPSNNLVQMASRVPGSGIVESLAASTPPTPRILERIPAPPFTLTPPGSAESALPAPFTRPQGSFAARAFGNATHAFLEQLATRIAASTPVEALKEELANWTPRITAVLRSSGLAPHEVQRFASTILRALAATLNDPTGLWILAPHPQSASESALISWNPESELEDDRTSVRLDRTFLAGPTPLTTGESHLWIIDYKTATHGPDGLEDFLAEQQAQYRPQLETYARQFTTHPIRLALFYPLLQRLIWWPAA